MKNLTAGTIGTVIGTVVGGVIGGFVIHKIHLQKDEEKAERQYDAFTVFQGFGGTDDLIHKIVNTDMNDTERDKYIISVHSIIEQMMHGEKNLTDDILDIHDELDAMKISRELYSDDEEEESENDNIVSDSSNNSDSVEENIPESIENGEETIVAENADAASMDSSNNATQEKVSEIENSKAEDDGMRWSVDEVLERLNDHRFDEKLRQLMIIIKTDDNDERRNNYLEKISAINSPEDIKMLYTKYFEEVED